MSPLSPYEDAILRFISKGEKSEQDIIDNFASKVLRRSQVRQLIRSLVRRDFIKISDDALLVGAMNLDTPSAASNSVYVYEIRGMGEAYLGQKSSSGIVYSNITNSNIANNSPNSKQSIHLSSQSLEVRNLVFALDEAVKGRDTRKIKEIFGYIADKSVDVAIALITGVLTR